jgi:hypothetical protein
MFGEPCSPFSKPGPGFECFIEPSKPIIKPWGRNFEKVMEDCLNNLYTEILYKPASTPGHKRSTWKTYVKGDVLFTTHGKEGGKMQTSKRVIVPLKSGKMTAHERALAECKRAWLKKLDIGYLPDEITPEFEELIETKRGAGGNNHGLMQTKLIKKPTSRAITPAKVHIPNLAKEYEFTPACRKYFDYENGVYVQPKLDGVRSLAYMVDGEVFLMSRKGKQWVWLNHIREQIKLVLNEWANETQNPVESVVLDGELYIHKLPQEVEGQRWNTISSICKTSRTNPSENETIMEYHVFDVFFPDEPQTQQTDRMNALEEIWKIKRKFKNGECDDIKRVWTALIHSEEEMRSSFAQFIEDGYEGIILRDSLLTYVEGKRDLRLRKFKLFFDDEFEIIGAEQAEGTQAGCVVWVCKSKGEDTFTTTIEGNFEYRAELYKNRDQYIGRLLTVRHQTSKEEIEEGAVPRFPVGIAIREDM